MGIGLNEGGAGVVRFFLRRGAEVTATDLKPASLLKPTLRAINTYAKKLGIPKHSLRFVLGGHTKADFRKADLIIKGPGVPDSSPYLAIARKRDIPIATDMEIFFAECQAPIIGVTGSKGKSTTASLIAHILKKAGKKVVLAGNIGASCLDTLDLITPETRVVLELSSWQLEGLQNSKKSPHIAVITNVLKEHLNRYSNFTAYAKAKSLVCAFQKEDDYCIINKKADPLRPFLKKIKSRILFFPDSKKRNIPKVRNSALEGEHNLENIWATVLACRRAGIPDRVITIGLNSYRGLPGRQERVAIVRGVAYYNDTTATMPDAAIAALKTLQPKPPASIILIAGGTDKKLDFKTLSREIVSTVRVLIFLPGNATDAMKMELRKIVMTRKKISVFDARTIGEAVRIACHSATKGDRVLLSPGAASFGLFQNEFDRGKQFVNSVRTLYARAK